MLSTPNLMKEVHKTLSQVEDTRSPHGRRFALADVLMASLLAQLCGFHRVAHQVAFFREHKLLFVSAFGGHWHRPPSHAGLSLILEAARWPQHAEGSLDTQHVALDGKCAKSSALNWLSVFDPLAQKILARLPFEPGHEQEAFIEAMGLLKKGTRVSGDAIHCQKKHSAWLMSEV